MILSNKSGADSLPLDFLTTLAKVDRYGRAKHNNEKVTEYLAEILDRDEYEYGAVNPMIEKVHMRMEQCASWLTFREYTEQKQVRLRSANFCSKHLLCQACAIRRGAQTLQAYMPKIEHVITEGGLTPYLITGTVRNGVSLIERFRHLERSLSALLNNRKCYAKGVRGFSYTEMVKIAGGVLAFEVPKARDGVEWHPHFHMLALCTDMPSAGWVNPRTGEGYGLRHEWFRITGDSFQFDVRRHEDQPLVNMACEVMKYAVKFTDQDPEDTWHAFQVLNRKRLIRSFGSLYGVKVPASMLDAPLSGPYIDRMFSYVGDGQYTQTAKIDCTSLYDEPMEVMI